MTSTRQVATSRGAARVHEGGPDRGRGLLVLGHGAGGGVHAVDLQAAAGAAAELGWRVALVEQPWRVSGRRVAEAPVHLDTAWSEVIGALARPAGAPLVLGGRSAGARVACRTAAALGADAVLALAFPLVPPRSGRSRLGELDGAGVPVLVVQGSRDAFGLPAAGPGREVVVVDGADHGFAVRRADGRTSDEVLADVAAAVTALLQALT